MPSRTKDRNVTEIADGYEVKSNQKIAALNQITAAIEHFNKKELECTITLAAAAEDILPATGEPHIFRDFNRYFLRRPEKRIDLNLVVNWLKHGENYAEVTLTEFEAAMMILRAITKFIDVDHQLSPVMDDYIEWARGKGYYPARKYGARL